MDRNSKQHPTTELLVTELKIPITPQRSIKQLVKKLWQTALQRGWFGGNLMWHYTASVRPANPPIGTLVDNIRGNPDVMSLKGAVFRGGSYPI